MFFGFFSILNSIKGNYEFAAGAIFIAGVFDGLDGWVARLTNSTTRFGIELDSLSDLVAFGVAPSVMFYKWAFAPFGRIGFAAAFLFTACGALRLARYNVQMGSTESKAFTGMPIPGAAGVLGAVVLFYEKIWHVAPERNIFMLILTIFLSILMVSTLRFHGLKEIDFKKRKPFSILVVIVVVFVAFVTHPPETLFAFAVVYLVWGIIENIYLIYSKRKKQVVRG
jgi:CDP-diacylglycerol--serine O-phosphatidyltransferase